MGWKGDQEKAERVKGLYDELQILKSYEDFEKDMYEATKERILNFEREHPQLPQGFLLHILKATQQRLKGILEPRSTSCETQGHLVDSQAYCKLT